MKMSKQAWRRAIRSIVIAALAGAPHLAAQAKQGAVSIGATDIGGVVTGPSGPEAGVWVIAETTDLPTKFAKIVVTDDAGPLRHPRTAERQLQRLGARLRPGRLAQSAERARQHAWT